MEEWFPRARVVATLPPGGLAARPANRERESRRVEGMAATQVQPDSGTRADCVQAEVDCLGQAATWAGTQASRLGCPRL
jgi:hypothetical protein